MNKKDVNEVVNDVQEKAEEIAEQVQEEVTEVVTKKDGKVKTFFKKHGKRTLIDIALFVGGVLVKSSIDAFFGDGLDITESNVAGDVIDMPASDANVDVVNF